MLWSIVVFILVLAILVLAHEFGHFFVALKSGVKIEEFGIGFPPRAKAFKGKLTTFSINWLPLGGFVKLKGEDGSHENEKDSFSAKSKRARAAIAVAGVLMNFLLAGVLFSIGYMIGVPSAIHENMPEYARISSQKAEVVSVLDGSSAQKAGVLPNDVVVGVKGYNDNFHAWILPDLVENNMEIQIKRNGETLFVALSPSVIEGFDEPILGIGLIETGIVSYAPHRAIFEGIKTTCAYIKDIVVGLGKFFYGLFAGRGVEGSVAGPVGIAVITGEVARLGFNHLIQFMAILSINLGVLNLIPFPALDGGRLLFIGIEAVRRKPVDKKFENTAHMIGFSLLMLLILLVTVKDVSQFSYLLTNLFPSL